MTWFWHGVVEKPDPVTVMSCPASALNGLIPFTWLVKQVQKPNQNFCGLEPVGPVQPEGGLFATGQEDESLEADTTVKQKTLNYILEKKTSKEIKRQLQNKRK